MFQAWDCSFLFDYYSEMAYNTCVGYDKGYKMNEMFFQRLASCVYDLVENTYDERELSYLEACNLIGLDDFETERVIAILDEDLRLV